jgi:hypothetical protein
MEVEGPSVSPKVPEILGSALPDERMIFDPDLITEAKEIVHRIQCNLKVVKSQQESYANKRRQPLEFEASDHVYICVSPM